MSDLVLFTNPQSRGRIAHWMVEELQLPYETVWLNYGPEMKSPNYLSINPMGKVPAIKHGDVVVTEAAAICAYLGDQFADKHLAPPSGSPQRAPYYRWLFFAAGPLEAAVTAKSMNWQVPVERQGMLGFGNFDAVLAALETALSNSLYLCGEQFTAADVYIGSSLGWGMMFGTIDKRPAFTAYVDRLYARPASQRANQLNEAHLKNTAS